VKILITIIDLIIVDRWNKNRWLMSLVSTIIYRYSSITDRI